MGENSVSERYSTILITGGAGFVGSNLACSFKRNYPHLRVVSFDNLKRRGSELNLPRLREIGVEFIHGDIRNAEDVDAAGQIDLLIECSAEPSVLAGWGQSPAYLINTNLVGAINCLEFARKHGSDFIFISTSRVYPYNAINRLETIEGDSRLVWADHQTPVPGWSPEGIAETFSLNGPRSMYGTTKLCAELLIQEYAAMYGVKAIINRCGLLAGPWQFGKVDQGICTYWMLAHYFDRPLTYIGFGGRGKQVRDILSIDDFFQLLERQIQSWERAAGKIYNVGGGKEMSLSLNEMTALCRTITSRNLKISSEDTTRPFDVNIFITDNSKAFADFGWKPVRTARVVLEEIYAWIRENESAIQKSLH